MSSLDNEIDMWDAINSSDRLADTVEWARTRRGDVVAVLTDKTLAATAHDGQVVINGQRATYYKLGKAFVRDGRTLRYGYLVYEPTIAAERQRRRDQEAWNETMRRTAP